MKALNLSVEMGFDLLFNLLENGSGFSFGQPNLDPSQFNVVVLFVGHHAITHGLTH